MYILSIINISFSLEYTLFQCKEKKYKKIENRLLIQNYDWENACKYNFQLRNFGLILFL